MHRKSLLSIIIGLLLLASCAQAAKITDKSPPTPPLTLAKTPTFNTLPSPTPTTSVPTDTPHSNLSRIIVPLGEAALIDGNLGAEEWQLADKFDLSAGGQIFLMHAEGYVYIGIRAKPEPVTSICIDLGDHISVLHSSAALGTAIYENTDGVWGLIKDFEWCCRETTDSPQAQEKRAEHLEQNGWSANNGRMGAPEEVEFQIQMPEDKLLMALTSIGAPDYDEIDWWPEGMDDDCRNPQMIRGSTPHQAIFNVDDWSLLVTAPE